MRSVSDRRFSMPEIKIACKGAALVPIEELLDFQKGLKTLPEANYIKLKDSISEKGFSFPICVWKHKNKSNVIDGHQRLFTVKRMMQEGWTLPEDKLPVAWIEARNEKEAKEKVLLAIGQYGEYTDGSVWEFVKVGELDFEALAPKLELPQIDVDRFILENITKPTGFLDNISAPGEDEQKTRTSYRQEDGFIKVTFALEAKEHKTVLEALKRAKGKWNLDNSIRAMVRICEEFLKQEA
jgi:hypothetical protein